MGKPSRWHPVWGLVCLTVAAVTAQAGTITIQSVTLSGTQIGLYEPLTVSFGLSKSYSNPYEPDAIDALFEFTGPSGVSRTIPAYWTDQSPAWRARIVPLEPGPHTGRIVVSDSAGDSGSYTVSFLAVASSNPGFIRIDSRNPRYLRFDNGQPYLPVGHNLCWYGGNPQFYEWMNRMAQAGENWTRYWMVPYVSQDIEWGGGTSYQLGRYSQSNARLIDNMLEGARSRGIYVQLCLDSFNGWNVTLYTNWAESPYNAANGGMCVRPNDFFINAEAQRLAKRRFRYIVARWAWNPAILCWEFFNEVDAVGGGGATFWGHEAEVAAWHQTMAQYIRSIDPFQHLRSTSFADDGPRSSYTIFWQLPEMEIVQVHQYSTLLPQEHVSLIRSVRQFGKPVIMGEGDYAGDPQSLDSNGQSLHDMIWAAAVIESGAMSWWWDNWIHPKNLYYRFEPLAAFLAGEDWAPQQLSPLSYTILSGHTTLYIRNWQGPVSGLRLRLNQVTSAGTYSVEYWDTNSNSPFQTATVTGSTGGLQLNLPNFARDVAVKVKQLGPILTASPPSLSVVGFVGHDPASQVFTVTNTGWGTADYEITDDASWLSVSPFSGSVADEIDSIAVSYSTASLAVGTYTALITVTDTAGFSPPATVSVILTVSPLPADLDQDGDVDQQDFGLFQICVSGQGVNQTNPGCAHARLDTDQDVDDDDATVFVGCMSGPSVPGDPACTN
jgi:hypothetical protein